MGLIPTEKTKPTFNLGNLRMFLYGSPKIGKSTFCSQIPDAVFAATEPGLNSLSTYRVDIDSWETFRAFCTEIAAGNHPFKTIIIDTIDRLYRLCETAKCAELGITTPAQMEYGKGFAMVNAEFLRVLDRLTSLPYGIVFVSHARTVEIKTPAGAHDKYVPTLSDKVVQYVLGLADIVAFATIRTIPDGAGNTTRDRVLCTKPHSDWEAGDRTGKLPDPIRLSYRDFEAALATVPATAQATPTPTPTTAPATAQAAPTNKAPATPGNDKPLTGGK